MGRGVATGQSERAPSKGRAANSRFALAVATEIATLRALSKPLRIAAVGFFTIAAAYELFAAVIVAIFSFAISNRAAWLLSNRAV